MLNVRKLIKPGLQLIGVFLQLVFYFSLRKFIFKLVNYILLFLQFFFHALGFRLDGVDFILALRVRFFAAVVRSRLVQAEPLNFFGECF